MDGSQDNSKEIADRLAGDRLNAVSLADKYNLDTDVVFVNGTQALVRMCLMQSEIDRQHGINSAGYVTGYRGSPLGGIDLQFAQASAPLTDSQIVFTPALNEDLAATAVWGTQQAALHGENTHDGVFAIWYGKGPGVDRTGDVFRHANLAGTDPKGGVLALMGDDHTGESSTVCHQSEYAMMDVMIPVLNPVNLEEMVQFGLHGWAMSRYSGLWVGLKCVKDNIESSSSARLSLEQFSSKLPNDVDLPEGGLNIRRNDHRHSQEERLHKHKIAAAHGYVRANQIDRVIYSGGKKARFGIVATGKAYMDVLQALSDLGISGAQADKMVSFELPEGDRFFFVANEEDEPIAYFAVSPFRESYAVGNVRKLKGGGFYATELYEKVMEVLGKGSLYSDKAQTEGGKGIWDRFPAKERVETEKEDGKRKWRWRISK